MSASCPPTGCATCGSDHAAVLKKLGLRLDKWDYVVALAGNPNTGKSTVFNNLTGLHQHTGNWPGKTVQRAEGGYAYQNKQYKIVDLPGTYSLLSASPDEEVARDFILFGRPDVTIIVADATCLERNLNLALQITQITSKAVLCLNLMDEARAHKMTIDVRGLSRDLGIPVVATAARQGEGMDELLRVVSEIATGQLVTAPHRLAIRSAPIRSALLKMSAMLRETFPSLEPVEWVALRLLGGDPAIINAVATDTLGGLPGTSTTTTTNGVNAKA